jgi:hypothetical protein
MLDRLSFVTVRCPYMGHMLCMPHCSMAVVISDYGLDWFSALGILESDSGDQLDGRCEAGLLLDQ